MELFENITLAPFTTFQIGGAARYLIEVRNAEEIKEAVLYAHSRTLPFVVLSSGSNVLIPDEGLNKLVIRIAEGSYAFADTAITADAGCNLLKLIEAANAERLGGWEKLSGIPGSIGGAVRGNAGAFNSEIKDFLSVVHALNSVTLQSRAFVNPYMTFSYRDSFFKQYPEWIITSVTVQLMAINRDERRKLIDETIAERERRHLQNVCAAGSFFMNPVVPSDIVAMFEKEKGVKSRESRVPAGWLIEKAGMKGATVGGAIASEQHPNYLVNTGAATAADVRALAEKVKKAVQEKFGVELHEEAATL